MDNATYSISEVKDIMEAPQGYVNDRAREWMYDKLVAFEYGSGPDTVKVVGWFRGWFVGDEDHSPYMEIRDLDGRDRQFLTGLVTTKVELGLETSMEFIDVSIEDLQRMRDVLDW